MRAGLVWGSATEVTWPQVSKWFCRGVGREGRVMWTDCRGVEENSPGGGRVHAATMAMSESVR
jgi:hypothetical protein